MMSDALFSSPVPLRSFASGNDDPYEPANSDEYVDLALQRYISNDRLTERAGNGSMAAANYDDQKDPEMQR